MRIIITLAAALIITAAMNAGVLAAEPVVVLKGLDNPCGIAVQPETGLVFVSDSAAGKVVKFDPKKPGTSIDVITDFPISTYGKGPIYNIGPLGLAFLDKNTLVVGGGGLEDGAELLRVYDVSGDKPIKAKDMKKKIGPLTAGDVSIKGEGNFYAVAIAGNTVYVASNGDDTKGWVLRADLGADAPKLEGFIATKEATLVDAPVGIAIASNGLIVVGQMGEITKEGDSLLTYYSAKKKKLVASHKIGLHDIAGLAYYKSDKNRLYAVDFAWIDTKQGGLFRLDSDGKGGVNATKIESLDKPSALAVGADGAIYVTVFGTAKKDSKEKPGTVVKITGNL